MKLLDYNGLCEKGIRYEKSWLSRLVKNGKFPRPIKLGRGRNAWVEAEIDAYIADLLAERDASAREAA